MALRADEGRDKLRKASGRSKYPLIRRYPNGETHLSKNPVGEIDERLAGSRVPRDTGNLVGSRRDHPPRLNTPQ